MSQESRLVALAARMAEEVNAVRSEGWVVVDDPASIPPGTPADTPVFVKD